MQICVIVFGLRATQDNKHSLGKPIVHKTLVLSKLSLLWNKLSTNQRACLQNFNQSVSITRTGENWNRAELNKSTFIWFCLLSLVIKIQIQPINTENISPILP